MKIQVLNDKFAVCKVAELSSLMLKSEFYFVAKTDDEVSLVCPIDLVPSNVIEVSRDWRAFRICGVLDFSLIGIIAEIATLLAKNKISIFATSTFNTDYILTKEEQFESALQVLKNSGYKIE